MGKALAVLDCFVLGDEILGVSELARRVGVAKSTAHRLCTLLVNAGYLERTAHDKYRLGVRLFELGSQVGFRLAIREAATRVLQDLTAATQETSLLAVLDGPDVLCVQKVETSKAPRVPVRLGQREAAEATAVGRALVAWAPGYGAEGTVVDLTRPVPDSRLAGELAEIRRAGVAIDPGEGEGGLAWVVAPVRNHRGDVVAALGLVGPTPRLGQARIDEAVEHVRRAAAAVSTQLGWRGDR